MQSYPYRILGTGEQEESLFFMLDSLLRSRIDTDRETSDDEDVNVYLAGLLHSFLDRSFLASYGSLISRYDTEVFARAEESEDLRTKYRVYKVNADYTLMAAGVLDALATQEKQGKWGRDDDTAIQRGKLYYRFASSYRTQLAHKKTAVVEVLEKLSDRFETYVSILSHMRKMYLNLLRRLSDEEIYHLQQEAQRGAAARIAEIGRDRFLDAYLDWLHSGSEEDRGRVNLLGEELSKIDPTFRFNGV